jgi:hypothetical protein
MMALLRLKSIEVIKLQMDRIYRLYGEGYGTPTILQKCEDKVYLIFSNMEY